MDTNRRYLVFVGDVYYPKPGMGNFLGDVDTLAEAKKLIAQVYAKAYANAPPAWHDYMWSYIWDSKTRAEIKEAV